LPSVAKSIAARALHSMARALRSTTRVVAPLPPGDGAPREGRAVILAGSAFEALNPERTPLGAGNDLHR